MSSIISGGIISGSGSNSSGSSGITSGIGSGLGSGITSGIFGITGPSGAMGFNSGSTGFKLILSGSGYQFSSKSNLGGVSGIGESLFSGVILRSSNLGGEVLFLSTGGVVYVLVPG